MPLARDCKETIQARIERDLGFREALLEEGGGLLVLAMWNRQVGAVRLRQRHHRV